jgi:signal peptidase II
MPRHWLGLALALGVVVLDRITKLWIQSNVNLYDTHTVIPGFFNIVHGENHGMAFGLGNDGATVFTRLFLIAISLGVLAVLGYAVWKGRRGQNGDSWALFLVVGGAFGNLYDRILYGSVTDFLDVYVGSYHWPTFNIADMGVSIGAVLLILHALKEDRRRKPLVA